MECFTKFNINADESRFRSLKTYRQVFDSIFDWAANS